MNPLLGGKVAVITGGSSGIGRAAALAFAREGAHVALGARRQTEGEETVRLVREAGGEALFVQTDVSQTDQVQRLYPSRCRTLGPPRLRLQQRWHRRRRLRPHRRLFRGHVGQNYRHQSDRRVSIDEI